MRTFITDGPCDATLHYVLPPATRVAEARSLVDQAAYFVLRAPSRSGKTTSLRALAAELTAEGRYAALVCSAVVASPARADLLLAQDALLSALRIAAEQDLPSFLRPPPFVASCDATRLWEGLSAWARACPRPIVLFFDDVDTLHGAALECLLRQLETGFLRRPAQFPWSIGLVSQYDLRDNGSSQAGESAVSFSTGPFERFWSSRLLPPFTAKEIRALYAQHFGDIDPRFHQGALAFVQEATAGHPFFVQALGREIAEMVRDSEPITKSRVVRAYRRLVERHVSPIEMLSVRLAEPRVRRVVEPLLLGNASIASVDDSDVQFVRDMGLVTASDPVRIDGALFRAIVPRLIAQNVERAVIDDPGQFFAADGRIQMDALLQAFASFYAAHAPELLAAIVYPKIAPELVFLGFLFHTLAGRGWVDVEFGTSRGRIDVLLSVPVSAGLSDVNGEPSASEQREVLVLVARRKGDSGVKKRSLEWLDSALQQASSDSGTVVVFDKRDKRDKRAPGKRSPFRQTVTARGTTVRSLRI